MNFVLHVCTFWLTGSPSQESIKALAAQLGSMGEHQEPQRMGAAYTLARLGRQGSDAAVDALGAGIGSERESMRRAAM